MKRYLVILISMTTVINFFAESSAEVVAYLFNAKGTLEIIRQEKKVPVSTICNELRIGDRVETKTGSSGLISYTNRSLLLKYPESHNVTKPIENKQSKISADEGMVVRGFTQSETKLKANRQFLLPPEAVKIDAVSIIRKKGEVYLLAPAVKSYSLAPTILIKNKDKLQVTVSLYERNTYSERLVGSIRTSSSKVSWTSTNWPKLKNDHFYRLKLTYQDKTKSTKYNSHVFSTISVQKQLELDAKLANLEPLAKLLMKGCLLLKEDCYGDAFLTVEFLLDVEPDNSFLQKLRARVLLGMERSSD